MFGLRATSKVREQLWMAKGLRTNCMKLAISLPAFLSPYSGVGDCTIPDLYRKGNIHKIQDEAEQPKIQGQLLQDVVGHEGRSEMHALEPSLLTLNP